MSLAGRSSGWFRGRVYGQRVSLVFIMLHNRLPRMN